MKRAALVLALLTVSAALAAGMMWALGAPGDPVVGSKAPGAADKLERALHASSPQQRLPLPDLRFADGSGAPRSLADFRGRFILLNVWATWCTPCRKEMPGLDRLQQALGGQDFEVVALSIDRGGIAAIEPFYEEMDLQSLRVYVDERAEALAALGALGIPVTLLVDPQGREIWRVSGAIDWDAPAVIERIQREMASQRNRAPSTSTRVLHEAVS